MHRASLFLIVFSTSVLAGCGGSSAVGTAPGGTSSNVTLLATSTANDQLVYFDMDIKTLALTSESGTAVSLISVPVKVEFIGVNGKVERIATASIPSGTYVSATASIANPLFHCATLSSEGGLVNSDFGDEFAMNATVNLPSPITVAGPNVALKLDLLVSKSATWTDCSPTGIEPYSITPTFDLTSLPLSPAPTNSQNGLAKDLDGIANSVSASNGEFTVTSDEGKDCTGTAMGSNCSSPAGNALEWQVATDASTVFTGIQGSAQLVPGMPVDMDVAIQADGSLLAHRISIYDSSTANLTIAQGPVEFISAAVGYPDAIMQPVRELGPLRTAPIPFNFGTAAFQISGGFTNLADLPFSPAFTQANMVPGQNVLVTTHASSVSAAPTDVPATTVTLLPQTINGTVNAIGSAGAFTAYTVTLAPYDLFQLLAVQPGQSTLINNPGTIVVYADENTQMLNTTPVSVGSVARFYGLMFNDNGTLRMDCAQINDGVQE